MNLQNRKYVTLILFVVVGIIYLTRLFYMQVLDDKWALRAADISEKRKLITPSRGHVIDRNGKLVVSNKPFYNLMMIEKNIKNFDTVAFAKLIGWEPWQVSERFNEIRLEQGFDINPKTKKRDLSRYRKARPYVFLKEVTIDEMSQIAPYLYKFPGFYEDLQSVRQYPYKSRN